MSDDQPKTSAEQHIERVMEQIDPASPRYGVLETAKRFKSSWVELGEKLVEVKHRSLFRDWGYDSFEDYCSREIRVKKQTAEKLTLAFRYLEKEEPGLLARRTELKPLPDHRSVDLLRQAREEQDFSDEQYADLRRAIVEEERSYPTVLKRFKEVAGPGEEEADPLVHIKAGLRTAKRLEIALRSVEELPEEYPRAVEGLIAHLERVAEERERPEAMEE